ncbi:Na/Pi cotransporter family protein [Methanomicrobium antiquum]|uniref:Na/Pi cotransporter family protein n=1 Tax=Methanomicrobium antiquum TaxID=487686 RepID=A0AAF0FSD3_9EURY|nr:Na/Pi cotransporter family protein [Methanomicrobium antiquum]WFN37604.1 Na/Pi cotransporter family protein [Methanomicrobium antiquum]
MISWELVFTIIPGIILFLYGIEQFSKEVQLYAGEYFRGFIQRLTSTPVRGTLVGTLVTSVIQSSMATTVITVGLVNRGIISFVASLGIIFGANLGTTLTSQLIALNLTSFAPFFILAGFVISIAGGKYKVIGRPVFYFGLVFFSLSLISGVMTPYQNDPQLTGFVTAMDNIFIQILFGMIITIIFQSSSVTTGLVVVMAQNGLITPSMAIPVLMGANLGTPSTTLFVAYKMNTSAKRAAIAHFLFNFLGVLMFLPFLGPFTSIIESLGGNPGQQVANAHLIFNLICCVVFLLAIKPFEKLVIRLVPGREDDIVFQTRYLKRPLPEKTEDSFKALELETVHLFEQSEKLLFEIEPLLEDPKKYSSIVNQLKEYANYLDDEISDASLELSDRNLEPNEVAYLAGLDRISKLGEILAFQTWELVEIIHQIQEKNILLAPKSKEAIINSLVPCKMNLRSLVESFPVIPESVNESMRERDNILRDIITLQYRQYLKRFISRKSSAGSAFSRALFQLEGMSATIREIRKSTKILDENRSGR